MAFYDNQTVDLIKSLKFAEYLRRSSQDNEDKQMRSIEGQEQDLKEDVINRFKIKIARVFKESQSAFKEGRPEFEQLIQTIEAGEINAVMVWHPNRIARNYSDGGQFVQLLSDGKLKLVLTPHGIFEGSPRDQEYLMTEFTRATRDSGDKSEAVKRGNRTKLKLGYIPSGRLPEGYMHIKNDKDEMITTTDPERYPLLKKAVKLLTDLTHTPMEALYKLNNEMGYRTKKTKRGGGNPLSKSAWYKLLTNPLYYGVMKRNEGEFETSFPALYSKEDFDKIQIILGNKAGRRRTKHDWAYDGGEITCSYCGSGIIMEEKWHVVCSACRTKFAKAKDRDRCTNCGLLIQEMKSPTIRHYIWVRCSKKKRMPDGSKCPQESYPVNDFEKYVSELISQITIPDIFTQWAIKKLKEHNQIEITDRVESRTRIEHNYNAEQTKLDKLLDLLTDGVIDNEEYQRKKAELKLKRESMKQSLEQNEQRADQGMELTEKTFNFARYAHYWFEKGSSEQKRIILRTLGSNLLLKDRILHFQERKPFVMIKNIKAKYGVLLEKFEPADLTEESTQNSALAKAIPRLLRGRDSNPDSTLQRRLSYH